MNIAINPDDRNRPRPNPKQRSFEDLVRDLEKKHPVPGDLKIPALPPSEEAVTEVVEYLKSVGLQMVDKVPTSIFVGGEILEREKIREGRIGKGRKTCVFAFLYAHADKRLRTVVIVPKDGIKARMLAKAVIWGLMADIPDSVAHSEIVEWEQFFRIESLNLNELLDAPLLEAAKKANQDSWIGRVVSLEQMVKSRDHEIEGLRKKIPQDVPGESNKPIVEEMRLDYLREQHRAEHWKLVALIASGAALVQVGPVAWEWIRSTGN